ncbi:MAG: patatin-like phospholipase family protein, partial [Planktothrix sp.]
SPVSGGYFPAQVAAMQIVYSTGYRPKIIGGSSGGNVANYITVLADFDPEKMETVMESMSAKLFATKWFPSPMPSEMYGFFIGSFFNVGNGGYEFISKFVNSSSIQRYEIWTGTYNTDHSKAQFFCNKSRATSLIDDSDMNLEILQSMEPEYCNGDLRKIAKVITASASIPGIVPAQDIDGNKYEDGGLYYASPGAMLTEALKQRDQLQHIIYINSFDVQGNDHSKPKHNVLKNTILAASILIKSSLVLDRLVCYKTLFPEKPEVEVFEFTKKTFLTYMKRRKNWKVSMLEVYPRKIFEVDITTFVGTDAVQLAREARSYLSARVWYIEK